MGKQILIILVIILTGINIYPENNEVKNANKNEAFERSLKSDLKINTDFYIYPYIYDFTNKLYGNSLNGSFFIGARLNQFAIGGEFYEHYTSLSPDENNNGSGLSGAWNIFRWTTAFFYEPASFFILKAGIGGAYFVSAFYDNKTGTVSKNEGGPSFIFDFIFKPPFEYIELKQINRLDLFIGNKTLSPYYYGGINCSFHPYYNFISLYLEAGVMTFFYSGKPEIKNTAMFVWSIGTAVNLDVFSIKNYIKEKITGTKNKYKNENKKPADNIEEKEKTETERIIRERLQKERNEKDRIFQEKKEAEKLKDDKIKISSANILFYPDSDVIVESSYSELDAIVNILAYRTDIRIELSGYTNNLNTPEEELLLSINRVESVKKYLIDKGISEERLTVIGYGSSKNIINEINESNRKVLFRIIEENSKK